MQDLEIPEPERRPIRPYRVVKIEPNSRVVISSGRFSSQDQTKIEVRFASPGCVVHFVLAEYTVRKRNPIRGADTVFLDTSRHAYSFFEKVKSLNPNVVLVRGKSELKGIIAESTRAKNIATRAIKEGVQILSRFVHFLYIFWRLGF